MWTQLKTILLFGVLTALLVGIGGALAPNYLFVFVVIALLLNLGAYFFSDKLVLRMYRARELGPDEGRELRAIVSELATTARIPMPRLFVVHDDQPNAFATGRNPAHGVVAVTDGIVSLLDARELRGVLAHEIAHIKNRDVLISTVAAVIASVITYIANTLSFGAMFGHHTDDDHEGSLLGGLVMLIVAPLAATLIQLAISRSRELVADETGAQLSGDPDALANALLKLHHAARAVPPAHVEPATANLFIVHPFGALDTLTSWLSTHPPVEERVRRLRALDPATSRRAQLPRVHRSV